MPLNYDKVLPTIHVVHYSEQKMNEFRCLFTAAAGRGYVAHGLGQSHLCALPLSLPLHTEALCVAWPPGTVLGDMSFHACLIQG